MKELHTVLEHFRLGFLCQHISGEYLVVKIQLKLQFKSPEKIFEVLLSKKLHYKTLKAFFSKSVFCRTASPVAVPHFVVLMST